MAERRAAKLAVMKAYNRVAVMGYSMDWLKVEYWVYLWADRKVGNLAVKRVDYWGVIQVVLLAENLVN